MSVVYRFHTQKPTPTINGFCKYFENYIRNYSFFFLRNYSVRPTDTCIRKVTQNVNFSNVTSRQPTVATVSLSLCLCLSPRRIELIIVFYCTTLPFGEATISKSTFARYMTKSKTNYCNNYFIA